MIFVLCILGRSVIVLIPSLTCVGLDEAPWMFHWAPCTMEEVAAWLRHSPMLASAHFIIWRGRWYSSIRWWHRDPSMWLFISLMCNPPSSWVVEDDPSSTMLPLLVFFDGTRSSSSNQFLSPFNK
jgi:hypothetical protein